MDFFFILIYIFLIEIKEIYNQNLKGIFPKKHTIITVYDYEKNRTSYEISQINDGNRNEEISFRISYLTEKNLSIIEKYSPNFNKKWVIFTQKEEILLYLIEVQKQLEKKKILPYYILGIIIPKKLNYKVNISTNIPIFEIEDKYIENFISFDFLNQTMNTFFKITHYYLINKIPETYLIFSSIIHLIISLIILITWQFFWKKSQNITYIQLKIFIHIYGNLLLSVLILFLVINMYGKEMRELESNQTFIVLYYIISIVNMLYRVFLWTDILLISTGYIILKSDFNKRDIKKHIIIIMSVSILMTFGMLTNNNFYIFSSYEITNLILYISSFIFVNFEGNKIIRILKRKLSFYIIFDSYIYFPTIKLKLKMINHLMKLVYIFTGINFFVLGIHKILLLKYDTIYFEIIQYHYYDCMLMIVLLFIFRPRKFPIYFDEEIEDDNFGTIYKCKIPKYEILKKIHIPLKKFKKRNIKDYITHKKPCLIINPLDKEIKENYNIHFLLYKSKTGYFTKD